MRELRWIFVATLVGCAGTTTSRNTPDRADPEQTDVSPPPQARDDAGEPHDDLPTIDAPSSTEIDASPGPLDAAVSDAPDARASSDLGVPTTLQRACRDIEEVSLGQTLQVPRESLVGPLLMCGNREFHFVRFARLTLRPGEGVLVVPGPDTSVSVHGDCDPLRCIGGESYFHRGDAPRTVLVALSMHPTARSSHASATLAPFPDAPSARCETAPRLEPGGGWQLDERTAGEGRRCDASGLWIVPRDNYARVVIPALHALRLPGTASVWERCDRGECDPHHTVYDNPTNAPREVIVVGRTLRGEDLRLISTDARSRCVTAPTATADGRVPDLNDHPAFEDSACWQAARWVSVSLPAGHRLAVAGYATVQQGCAARGCLGPDASGTWFNPGPSPLDLRVAVRPGQSPADVRVRALPVDPSRLCRNAPRLTPEAPLRDLTFVDPGETLQRCELDTLAPRFARVEVSPGQRMVVEASEDLRSALLDDCERRACLQTGFRQLVWTNSSLDTVTRVIAVAGSAPVRELRVHFETPRRTGTCAAPTPFTPGDTLQLDGDDGQGMIPACGPTGYHLLQAEVPTGQRVVVLAHNGFPRYPTLSRVISGCDTPTCPEWEQLEPSTWENTTDRPQRALFAIPRGRVTVDTSLERRSTHGRCADAMRVTPGTALGVIRGIDAVEAAPVCAHRGPALYYAVRVGARRSLVVTHRVISGYAVYVLDRCGGDCLPVSVGAASVDEVERRWDNLADAPREVIVAVVSRNSAALRFDDRAIP